ncbi:BTB/POZ domain-containing protein 19 isoform X3 [Hyperolius riggenbachi]|uniref:BTB/POZ domain-containing protein 19 isoform X3 n=1 Tax=Hyperolius riggenbachi TaxID=752182 RepID=UPI0035A2A665
MAKSPALAAASVTLQGKSSSLSANLRELINNTQFSDVSFVVGKERQMIHAHRCVLACRCKVFHSMFTHQLQGVQSPQELQIPFVLADMNPEVFLAVLEFIYTNSVTLTNQIALEVLTSAVEYGLDNLRKLCVDYIGQSLTVEMACEALQAAVTYGQTDLRQRCLTFIERHTPEIVKTQSFRELSDLGIVSILQSDRLSLDEGPLIQAVREWARVNSEIQIAQSWKFHALKKAIDSPHLFRRRKGTLPRDHHRYLDPPPK